MEQLATDSASDRLTRAIIAAEASYRAGGAVLPEAKDYKLPPMLTGLDIAKMGRDAWARYQAEAISKGANWYHPVHMDVMINLDHPDVKAVL